jgi:hypothetical protein
MNHPVAVRLQNGQHLCEPTQSDVRPGDTMRWDAGEPIVVSFPNGSPFVEGAGPFKNGQEVTVKGKPPLQGGEVFVPVTTLSGTARPTKGNIKVT